MADAKSETKPTRAAGSKTRRTRAAEPPADAVATPEPSADGDGSFGAGILDEVTPPVAADPPEPRAPATPEPPAPPPAPAPAKRPTIPAPAPPGADVADRPHPAHGSAAPRADSNEYGFDAETNSRYEEIKRGNTYITQLQQMTLAQLQAAAK